MHTPASRGATSPFLSLKKPEKKWLYQGGFWDIFPKKHEAGGGGKKREIKDKREMGSNVLQTSLIIFNNLYFDLNDSFLGF